LRRVNRKKAKGEIKINANDIITKCFKKEKHPTIRHHNTLETYLMQLWAFTAPAAAIAARIDARNIFSKKIK
jgi:hypothetical protein